MNPNAQEWSERYAQGESYADIAITAGVTREVVRGVIRRRGEVRVARPVTKPKPTPTPKHPKAARRQAVHPEPLARFDAAAASGRCLWIDGDLRDGHTAVCGMRRAGRNYCAEHGARVYDQRPRKPVSPV